MIRTGQFRFIPIGKLEAYHPLGWMFVADAGWPFCIIWRCDCEDQRKAQALRILRRIWGER